MRRLHGAARTLSILVSLASIALAAPPRAAGNAEPGPPAENAEAGGSSAQGTMEQHARDLCDAGTRLYEQGAYVEAARAFRSAFALTRTPALLYNLAQAERLAGDCSAALHDYARFEEAHVDPLPPDIDEKIADMEHCAHPASPPKPTTDTAALPVVAKDHPPASAETLAPPRAVQAPPDHGVRRAVAYGTAAMALASGTLGAVFAVRAHDSAERLTQVNQTGGRWGPGYSSEEDSFRHSRNSAIGLFVGSGVLAVATVWLLLTPTSTQGSVHPAWTFAVEPGRASTSAAFRF